ncbi:PGAP1-like alpha/beta domain-containing protein [Metabacillus sp. Hm71]|uniref:esterase/lipase family protein n=1 Tax=Metabacillus sp. Hm71 TaxID=3450743 RepID=UPI003F443CE3
MIRKLIYACVGMFFLLPPLSHACSFGKDDPSGIPGQWYVGTKPSNVSPSKYPILFIHGLNSSSKTWWNENNMYDTAYQNSYETAFIDLHPTKNMWDNGKLLAGKIRDISNYFGEKVVIVAHSKGGIDAQSALVHYGAFPYVERVITLSAPHYGSQLADLAYSSWAGWLTGIIGSKNDATYSLQTGYMNYFRSKTDYHANASKNPFYTFGGTKWGSFGSSLYWGGLYLSGYGANDGAVTVNSSKLSYGTELKVGEWNHTTIKEGTSTFHLFKPYLNELYETAGSTIQAQDFVAAASTDLASYTRGGEFTTKQQESFVVEEGVKEITINWISSVPVTELTLKDPTNKPYTSFTIEKDATGYFSNAYHHSLTIQNPQSGQWSLNAESDKLARYLLNITFDSPLLENLKIDLTDKNIKFNTKDSRVQIKTDLMVEYYKNGKLKMGNILIKEGHDGSFKLPKIGEGVYNITIDMTGKLDKQRFQRTMIKTVYIDAAGKVYFNQ